MHFKKIASAAAATIMAVSMIGGTGITASAANYRNLVTDKESPSVLGLGVHLYPASGYWSDDSLQQEIKNINFDIELLDKNGNYIADLYSIRPGASCNVYDLASANNDGYPSKRLYLKKNTKYYISIKDPTNTFMPVKIGYECSANNSVDYFYRELSDSSTNAKHIDMNVSLPRWGDINYDGKVDFQDLGALQQALNGWKAETPLSGEKDSYLKILSDKNYLDQQFLRKNLSTVHAYYRAGCTLYYNVGNKTYHQDVGKYEDDAEMLNRVFNNYYKGSTYGYSPADVNGDGKVNSTDLAHLQRYLAGWNVQLGK